MSSSTVFAPHTPRRGPLGRRLLASVGTPPPPTPFSLLPHRAANGSGPRGMQVPKFRDMVASLCQVIRLRLFLIITIENVTGGLGLFFPHMSARIVMHSVVVQAHVRKTYWDELADLPTQPCLCTVSPHQGSSKWEARGRRLGLSLRTQPAVLDTMARSSSISTTGRTSRRFAAGNEALRSSLSSNPLFRLTLPCKSR